MEKQNQTNISEIWFNNAWKMLKYNLLWLLFNLPFLALTILLGNTVLSIFFPQFAGVVKQLAEGVHLGTAAVESIGLYVGTHMVLLLTIFLLGNLLFCFSPLQTAYASIFYLHINRDHVFFIDELKDKIKENLRQSLTHQALQVLFMIVFPLVLSAYRQIHLPQTAQTLIFILLALLFILWMMMQTYIYQMIFRYELKLKDIYKNALIFTLAELPRNLWSLVLGNLVLLLIPFVAFILLPRYALQVTLIYTLFLPFSISQLIYNRTAIGVINKYFYQEGQR